jgi:hypothetical protein
MRVTFAWLVVVALLGACGSSSSPADTGTPDSGPQTGFKEDPHATGASVYLTVDVSNPSAPAATLWATQLGPVFGLALRLKLDPTRLVATLARTEPWLGADEPKAARYLVVSGPDTVSFGAVRRGPAAGEQTVNAPVKLATIPLHVVATGQSRLEIADLQVRRADGTFVPVTSAGGTLTLLDRGAP